MPRNIGLSASDPSGYMLRILKPIGADSFRNTPGPGQGANALLSGTQERGGSGARPVPLDEVGSRVAVPLHRPKKSREGRGVLTSASSTPPGLHDRPRYHPRSPGLRPTGGYSVGGAVALRAGSSRSTCSGARPQGVFSRPGEIPGRNGCIEPVSPCWERARSVAGRGGVQGMWPAPELRPRPPPDPRGFASVDRSLTP